MENNENNEKKRRIFDDVFQLVRTMGPYQIILYIGIGLLQVPMGLQLAQSIFALGTPQFHCSDANSTCPPNKCCDNCTAYDFDGPFTSTVSEWNLLCDQAYLGASIQSSYFAGMLIGSFISGWIADAFGRRISIYLSITLVIVFGVGASFANSIPLMIFLRFFSGFSLAGCMLTQFVYIVELVGPNKRTHAGKAQNLFWKPGGSAAALLGYFVRDWRLYLLIGSLVGIIYYFFCCVIPETARWSLSHDRIDDAQAVLTKCGGKKNKTLDQDALRKLLEEIRNDEMEIKGDAKNKKRHTPLDLVRTPKLRKRTIIVCFNWFVVALVYFGFDLYSTQLPGSIYLNYFLMNLTDIPVLFISWFTVYRYGRRIPYCAFMFIVGVCSFIILGLPGQYTMAIRVLAILGRAFVASEFNNIYLMTTELFPTVVRNTAMGSGSTAARVGAILSPYIVMMAQLPGLSITLPVTIFGVLALIASVVTLWLPETLFANMHQTIEEAEAAEEDFGVPCCRRRIPDYEQEYKADLIPSGKGCSRTEKQVTTV